LHADSQLCRRAISQHLRSTGFVDVVIDDIKEVLA
jgi:hypothetical protein